MRLGKQRKNSRLTTARVKGLKSDMYCFSMESFVYTVQRQLN